MLLYLLPRFAALLERFELAPLGESRTFLTARTALASLTAFLLAVGLGPRAIRWLRARFQERIASASDRLNELHKEKAATPTMGGVFILAAIGISMLLWSDLTSRFTHLGLLAAGGFGLLGAIDDWIKIRTKKNGLTARQKFAYQAALAVVISALLYMQYAPLKDGLRLFAPIGQASVSLGAGFVLWSVLVLVGSSNAVNLTDGLDGLASGCMVFAGSAFIALAYLSGHRVLAEYLTIPYLPGSGEFCIVLGATVGATLGFLWFNCHPAEVFMGDAGSLPLGGLIGLAGLITRQEILLVVIGGIFVVETLSVIAQVASFRLTGRRILACSPLHNHFVFQGLPETKIVIRFWIVAALLAIFAVASLNVR